MTYRCLIVDDEPLARRVLSRHIAEIPSQAEVGQCANTVEAAAFLHQHEVDVLFLDIRMPGLSGLDLLKTLTRRPQIILTTAFSEYALEGYEHAVVDYLLKPISLERFLQAVNKLRPVDSPLPGTTESLMLRVDNGDQRVQLDAIDVVEAAGNFVKIHTGQNRILASETMKNMKAALPEDQFIQVHRSFIVAVAKVERYAAGHLIVAGREIPVGRSFRKAVENRVQRSF